MDKEDRFIDDIADYDLFQYENRIKGDCCNQTILEDYCDEETGIDDIDEYFDFIEDN